jgi:hypothetical protein
MNSQQREQVLSQVQHLSVSCPHDNCNPSFCPLHDVRKLTLEERMKWVRALSDEELEYLITYHQICLQWMNGIST